MSTTKMATKIGVCVSALALGCAAVAVPSAQAFQPWTAGETQVGQPDGARPEVAVTVSIEGADKVEAGQEFNYKVTYQATAGQQLAHGAQSVTFTAQEGTTVDWRNIQVEGAPTPRVEVTGRGASGRTGTFNLPAVGDQITLTIPARMPDEGYLKQHPEYIAKGSAEGVAGIRPAVAFTEVANEHYRYPDQTDPCVLRTAHVLKYDGGGYGTWLAELDFGFGANVAGENRTVRQPTFQFYDSDPVNPDGTRNTDAKQLEGINGNVRGYNPNFDVPLEVRQSDTSLREWNKANGMQLDSSLGWNFDPQAGVGDTWVPDGTYILVQHTVANTKCESDPAQYTNRTVPIESRVHVGHNSPLRTAMGMGSDQLVRRPQETVTVVKPADAPEQPPRQDPAVTGDASVGSTAWLDANLDGQRGANERGVPNIVVLVSHPGELTRMTTTDENGKWRVEGLSPYANYEVRYVIPEGWTATAPVPDATDENGLTTRVTALPEGVEGTLDVGLHTAVEISTRVGATGGNVWHPGDDGKRVGIPGVEVRVIGFEGLGEDDRVTTTDANGAWYVTGLTPGVDYRVEFTLPDGYYATSLPQGATLDDGKVVKTVPIRTDSPAVFDGNVGVENPAPKDDKPAGNAGSSETAGRCWENAKRSPFFYMLPVGLLGLVAAPFAQPYINGALAQLAVANPQAYRTVTDPNAQMAAGAAAAIAALGIAGGLLYDWCSNEPGQAATASSTRGGSAPTTATPAAEPAAQ